MCNRGRSCKASAEPLADYAEPQPTEEQSKPKALLLKLSSLIHTVQLLLTVDRGRQLCVTHPLNPPPVRGTFLGADDRLGCGVSIAKACS